MEEKTGKIQRRTQSSSARSLHDNDSSQSDHIPVDLTTEILSRLPAKSVGRFRSVSKLWSAITTSQDFINSFPTRSLASRPSVLLAFYIGNILYVFSLHKNSPVTCVGSYQHTKPNYGCYRRFDYLRGLILLQDNNSNYLGGILGYDQIDGKYIVLRVLRDSKICILTLGAQGKISCRIITNCVPRHRSIIRCGEC
ncbi:unnamed protein product [Arabidopsis halleri]